MCTATPESSMWLDMLGLSENEGELVAVALASLDPRSDSRLAFVCVHVCVHVSIVCVACVWRVCVCVCVCVCVSVAYQS